jgi:superfamily II DNA/RNA helicase
MSLMDDDDCHDVIVKVVGSSVTAPPPFPIKITKSTSGTSTSSATTLSSNKSDNHHNNDNKNNSDTRINAPDDPAEEEEERTRQQQHLSILQAWNSDKMRRQWTPRMIQRQTWSILLMRLQQQHGHEQHQRHAPNLVAIAPTSSGKTLAYGMPMLCSVVGQHQQQSSKNNNNNRTKNRSTTSPKSNIVGLVLVPTRELCSQVQKELGKDHAVAAIHGGRNSDIDEQVAALKKRPTVVVATPGRFLDILQNTQIKGGLTSKLFSGLSYFVLDEADRLAIDKDMAEQVDQIIRHVIFLGNQIQQQPTVVLFSATAPHKVQKKWIEWVGSDNHIHVHVGCNSLSLSSNKVQKEQEQQNDKDILGKIPDHLAQTFHLCTSREEKFQMLVSTLAKIQEKDGRQRSLVLVFFREIKTLLKTSQLLQKATSTIIVEDDKPTCTTFAKKHKHNHTKGKGKGKKKSVTSNHNKPVVAELHGKMLQPAREQALQNFRSGKIPILLATDICARGVHVPNVWYVINYDFPDDLEQVSLLVSVLWQQQSGNQRSFFVHVMMLTFRF